MELNLTPVNVDVKVENFTIKSSAFYSVCFITGHNTAPRTIEVTKLKDLLDNGYSRDSLAYNFCRYLFMQQGVTTAYVRAKRNNETYETAFNADDNSDYYYVVIDSKDISSIIKFNDYINQNDPYKLQFFSTNTDVSKNIKGKKIVHYYQPTTALESFSIAPSDMGSRNLFIPKKDYTFDEIQSMPPFYPESCWIGRCGHAFPSRMQWLHKYLAGVVDKSRTTISYFSSNLYPTPVDGDGYKPNIKPLDITLKSVLKRGYVGYIDAKDNDVYQPNVKPLNITLRDVVLRKPVDDGDAYKPTVKPLDITLKSVLKTIRVDDGDAYKPTVKPLDIILKRVVVRHNVDEHEAYQPSVTPLDITLKKGV